MRRTTLIASQLLRLRSDACVLTLGDSRLGQFFDAASNHDYLKLPSILKVGPGDWRAIGLSLPFADVHAMRKELIRSAVMSFNPHILLVDHMPHGAMGELLPTLAALRASGSDTKVVLGLRDILDAPAVVQRVWRAEGAYDAIERFYDQVLIYGPQEVFDLPAQYGFSPAMAEKARFCGYVCTPEAARYTARARAKYVSGSADAPKLIVAMAGGGADAYPFMRALLEALPALQAQQRCTLALITGPFMPAEQRRDLEARARGLPAQVSRSVSDTLSYIEAADLVVAMAGYNTTMEILRSGKRAILIPRAGPSAEQRMRASLCAAQGWVDMIDPDDLSTEHLVPIIDKSLRNTPAGVAMASPYLSGLNAAAAQLAALLPEPVVASPAILQRELNSAAGVLV
jgi:predicted glycosyltransferase